MSYKGKYRPKNQEKYKGDIDNIIYRSLWERNAFRWLDANSSIKYWNSEEVVIPYICKTDKKRHRYFMDLWFETIEGSSFIVEIKPKSQTKKPGKPKSGRVTKRFLREQMTYVKNLSKWEAATEFARKNNLIFEIWTEQTLKTLGISVLK